MKLSVLFRKIQRNAEDYGARCTLKKGVFYFLRPVYEKKIYRIYGRDIDTFQNRPCDPGGYAFSFIEANDRDKIVQIEKMEEWLQGKVEMKLRKGGICLAVLDKDKVVGFNLVSFGEVFMPLINHRRHFEKDEAYSEQITVHKEYRGKDLATALRYRVFGELKARGIKKFYGGTLIDNQANLKLTRKVGFRELYDIHYTSVFGFKRWRNIEMANELA